MRIVRWIETYWPVFVMIFAVGFVLILALYNPRNQGSEGKAQYSPAQNSISRHDVGR